MKIRQRLINTVAAAVLSVSWTSAVSQEDSSPLELSEDNEPRRYTVEIVIFRYAEDVATGSEQFYADQPDLEGEPDDQLVAPERIEELQISPAERRIDLGPYYGEPPKFVLLGEDEYTMTGILGQFDRLDVYQTIMHFGWTQVTHPDEPSKAVDLRVFGDPPAGLDGSLTLYLTRYLHLVVDLRLSAEGNPDLAGAAGLREAASPGLSRFGFGDSFRASRQPIYYRISENRIVRSGDLRYFDHPKFGVIAKVTRIEDDTEDGIALPGIAGQ